MSDSRESHILKTWPEPFTAVWAGTKHAELRRDDRDYRVNDHLILEEYDPESRIYSGRKIQAWITHVLPGGRFGLAEGYAMLSIDVLGRIEDWRGEDDE
jgi:hypothetical protein